MKHNELDELNCFISGCEMALDCGLGLDEKTYNDYQKAISDREALRKHFAENKVIVVINGGAGVGKDTFISFFGKYVPTAYIHIADFAKTIARSIGWNGRKDEKGRRLLSDIKVAIDNYNDGNFNKICEETEKFLSDHSEYAGKQCLYIAMREPADIERFQAKYKATSLLIVNNNVTPITSNIGDAGVSGYNYDYVITNNGSLEALDYKAEDFAKNILQRMKSL